MRRLQNNVIREMAGLIKDGLVKNGYVLRLLFPLGSRLLWTKNRLTSDSSDIAGIKRYLRASGQMSKLQVQQEIQQYLFLCRVHRLVYEC